MKRNIKNDGFTLPELLVGMLIFIILLAAISFFLVPGVSSTKYALSQENSLSKARISLNKIVDTVKYAPRSVTAPSSTGTGVNQISYLDADANECTIERDADNKSITITQNGAVVETLAEGLVKNLEFSLDTANSDQVTVSITLNDDSYAASPDIVLTTVVKMENI